MCVYIYILGVYIYISSHHVIHLKYIDYKKEKIIIIWQQLFIDGVSDENYYDANKNEKIIYFLCIISVHYYIYIQNNIFGDNSRNYLY